MSIPTSSSTSEFPTYGWLATGLEALGVEKNVVKIHDYIEYRLSPRPFIDSFNAAKRNDEISKFLQTVIDSIIMDFHVHGGGKEYSVVIKGLEDRQNDDSSIYLRKLKGRARELEEAAGAQTQNINALLEYKSKEIPTFCDILAISGLCAGYYVTSDLGMPAHHYLEGSHRLLAPLAGFVEFAIPVSIALLCGEVTSQIAKRCLTPLYEKRAQAHRDMVLGERPLANKWSYYHQFMESIVQNEKELVDRRLHGW